MKTSRIYESLLILSFLCCLMIMANNEAFAVAEDTKNYTEVCENAFILLQIDHPRLLIGPMDGFCANHYFTQINPFISSYYTNSICNSKPLAPEGVLSNFFYK